jgi:tyrosinase
MSLGPIQTTFEGVKSNPQADGLGYNPRCLSRDVNKDAAYGSRDEEIMTLITGNNNVLNFQNRMQGDFANKYIGVHTAGHYTIGGDAGSDFFNSPSDPVSALPNHGCDIFAYLADRLSSSIMP